VERALLSSDAALNKSHAERSAKRWAAGWATAGAATWAAIAVLARVGVVRIGAIELMFLFAPLVIFPLGLELARGMDGRPVAWAIDAARTLQPLAAVLVVVAMLLPPGNRAVLAALGWAIVCGLVAASGAVELVRIFVTPGAGRSRLAARVGEIACAIAKVDLAVGGAWLLASRAGLRPFGIQEPIGILTAIHFHFAGFATALIASSTLRFQERRGEPRWLRRIVMFVVLMPFLVAAGFVISPALKMAAALAFSLSVVTLAVFLWRSAAHVEEPTGRRFLHASAGAVFASMALSATYAITDFLKSDFLTIPRMTSTHGILNAAGFCLLGLLGWLIETQAATPVK
jgi:hypothetical protein